MRFAPAILIAALVFIAMPASAQKVDAATAKAIQAQIFAGCKSDLERALANRQKDANAPEALAKWISDITDPGEYCSCTSARIAAGADLSMVQPGGQPALAALAKRSGTECMLPRLKKTFPSLCTAMVAEAAARHPEDPPTSDKMSSVCACTAEVVNNLKVSTFEPFARATLKDYAAFMQTRELPPPGDGSLIARMNACGFSELKGQTAQ